MEISQIALARLYLIAFILGAGLGLCYDALRITRVFLGVRYSRRASDKINNIRLPLLKPKVKSKESPFLGTVIFFEDFLFGLFCGICMILLFYGANNGKLRFPAMICTCGGFFLYRGTLGRLIMLFSEVISFAIGTVVRYLCYFIGFPFRWIWKKLLHAAQTLSQRIRKKHLQARRAKQTARVLQASHRNACGMIPHDVKQKGRLKRGHRYGTIDQKEAVQPEHAHANIRRRDRSRVTDRVRKQRHEIQ